MMIRKAEQKDLEAVIELGRAFFEEAKTDLTPEFSEDKAASIIQGMIESDACILYVAEEDGVLVGMIGAIVSEHWFSNDTVAQELFWYVLPDCRLGVGTKLLDVLEVRSKELGVSHIAMVDLGEKSPVDILLKRRGYLIHEKTYVRKI